MIITITVDRKWELESGGSPVGGEYDTEALAQAALARLPEALRRQTRIQPVDYPVEVW